MTRTQLPEESRHAATAAPTTSRDHAATIARSLAPTVYCPARQVEQCFALTRSQDAR
jgi:hypothetical protein